MNISMTKHFLCFSVIIHKLAKYLVAKTTKKLRNMRKLPFYKKLIVFAFSSAILVSCTTDVDWENQFNDLKLDQSVVLPIGEAVLELDDILNQFDSLEFVDNQGSDIYMKLNDTIEWTFNDVKTLGNTTPMIYDVFPSFLPNVNNKIVASTEKEVDLAINSNPEQQRIDSVRLTSAKMFIKVSVDNLAISPSDVKIILTFPIERLAFNNGQTQIEHIPSAFDQNETEDLPASTLRTLNNATSVPVNVKIELTPNAAVITPGSKISLSLRFTELSPIVVFGYFSPTMDISTQNQVFDLSGFISKIPENGEFKVAEPNIDLNILNYTGIRLGLNIDEIKAYRTDNSITPVFAKFNGQTTIVKKLKRVMQYGQGPADTTITLNHLPANGEIQQFFAQSKLPDKLSYKFRITNERLNTDPLDFITMNAKVVARVGVKIPLKLNAGSWFELKGKIDSLELDSLLKDDLIEKAQLILKVSNGLPVKTTISLAMLDKNGLRLPLQLLSDSVIPAPALNNDGTVNTNSTITPKYLNILVDKTHLDDLKKTKTIEYTLRVDSKEGSPITFQKENSFRIKLGVYLKGDANIKFD